MPSLFSLSCRSTRYPRRRFNQIPILSLCLFLILSFSLPLSASESAFAFAAEYDRTVSAAGSAERPVSLPSVYAKGAILMNGKTGTVYFERNADARLPMASTTKIMTALVAVEALPLDTVITVDRAAVGVEGSSVYLYEGEKLTLEALLYALLLQSANDAAVAIAYGVAGGIPEFAEMMNDKACSLGLTNTNFENPHGLDSEEHYTTARDLAKITSAALSSDVLRTIVSTYKMTIPQQNTNGIRLLVNHNRLLRSYDGCIGVKTGYTRRSGRCLVSAADRDGLLLIAVTLSSSNDWKEHKEMLDYGYSMYESVVLSQSGELSYTIPVFNGISPSVTASYKTENGDPLSVILPKNHSAITCSVELPQFLWGTYKKGSTVGRVIFFCNEKIICEVPLTLDFDVPEISYRLGLFNKIKSFFTRT